MNQTVWWIHFDSDRTYLGENEKVKGFFFIVFMALRIRFSILKILKDSDLVGKISVNEVLMELSKMEKIVEKDGREYLAAVPKKVEVMARIFKNQMRISNKLLNFQWNHKIHNMMQHNVDAMKNELENARRTFTPRMG